MLPNSLFSGFRKFITFMKYPIATLRINGYIATICIDALIDIGLTFKECVDNIMASIELLDYLGFIIHPGKFTFMPKNITFLGFKNNSIDMKISLTNLKKEAVWHYC